MPWKINFDAYINHVEDIDIVTKIMYNRSEVSNEKYEEIMKANEILRAFFHTMVIKHGKGYVELE